MVRAIGIALFLDPAMDGQLGRRAVIDTPPVAAWLNSAQQSSNLCATCEKRGVDNSRPVIERASRAGL